MVHWPGTPAVAVDRKEQRRAEGIVVRTSNLSMDSHTGTHIDAPVHFDAGKEGVDALPFAALIGEARVVAIRDPAAIRPGELEALDIRRGDRLLFKTRNSTRCWGTDAFVEDYVYVSLEAAQYLVERGARTVGVDYLSVASRAESVPTHRTLLAGGVTVLEGLDLSSVEPGKFDLIALPLRVHDGDGAPARVVLRPRSDG
jgi:arylformamidase